MGHYTIYPNLYVILVAESGKFKSSTIKQIRKVIDEGNRLTNENDSIFVLPDCESREALVAGWEDHVKADMLGQPFTPACAILTELKHFLSINPTAMIEFLVTVFDYEGEYRMKTIKHDEQQVMNPCLTLFACSTPERMSECMSEDIIGEGLARRTILVKSGHPRSKIAFPNVSDDAL